MSRTSDPLRRLTAGRWQPLPAPLPAPAAATSGGGDAGDGDAGDGDAGPVAAAWARHAAAPGRGREAVWPGDGDDADGPGGDAHRGDGRLATALTVPLPVVVGAVALVLGAGGWWLWQQVAGPVAPTAVLEGPVVEVSAAVREPSAQGTAGAAGAPGDAPGDPDPPSPAASATVHVAGAVGAPGIVVVAPGARVVDAVAAAGGLSEAADVAGVNLARPVTDGEMIVVPTPGQAVPAQGGGTVAAPGEPAGPRLVDLNRASPAELEELPGIGPVLAARIVQWREDTGPFTAVDDLTAVPGIGPAVLEGLRDLAAV